MQSVNLLNVGYIFSRGIAKIYIFIFARPSTQPLNNLILQLALRGRGYNNCCDPKTTDEAIFIKLLAKNNPTLCIDIGANKGHYSEVLLSETNAVIIAFKPLPKLLSIYQNLNCNIPIDSKLLM